MKLKGDTPQIKLPQVMSQQAPVETNKSQVSAPTTQGLPADLAQLEARLDPAWRSFSQQPSKVAVTQMTPQSLESTALRQQMRLAQEPSIELPVSPDALAKELGIEAKDLALSPTAQVKSAGSVHAPSVQTDGPVASEPMATPRTPTGPGANPARSEAKAALESVIEQSYMPFDTKSDNMARELAGDPKLLAALTPSEKGRLMTILNSGYVGNDDQKAMLQILRGAESAQDFTQLVQLGGGADAIGKALVGENGEEFQFLIDKHMTGVVGKDHPLREEARGAFEGLLREHHRSFDTKADDMARDLAGNTRLMNALTPAEKGRMIQIMGSGYTGEGDEEAIISTLKSAQDSAEFFDIVQSAGGPEFLNGKLDWKEQGQLNYLFDKFRREYKPQQPQMQQPQMQQPQMQQPQMQAPTMMNPNMMSPNMVNPTMMGQNMMYPSMGMGVPGMMNPWTVPVAPGFGGGYGMAMPQYNMGMTTGIGQAQDFGLGRQSNNRGVGSFLGGVFKSVVGGVMDLVGASLRIGSKAGIGFLLGGPAGAALGAIQGCFGELQQGGGMPGGLMMGALAMSMGGGMPFGGAGSYLDML